MGRFTAFFLFFFFFLTQVVADSVGPFLTFWGSCAGNYSASNQNCEAEQGDDARSNCYYQCHLVSDSYNIGDCPHTLNSWFVLFPGTPHKLNFFHSYFIRDFPYFSAVTRGPLQLRSGHA